MPPSSFSHETRRLMVLFNLSSPWSVTSTDGTTTLTFSSTMATSTRSSRRLSETTLRRLLSSARSVLICGDSPIGLIPRSPRRESPSRVMLLSCTEDWKATTPCVASTLGRFCQLNLDSNDLTLLASSITTRSWTSTSGTGESSPRFPTSAILPSKCFCMRQRS